MIRETRTNDTNVCKIERAETIECPAKKKTATKELTPARRPAEVLSPKRKVIPTKNTEKTHEKDD